MDTAYTVYAYEYATAAEAVGANTYAYNFLYAPSEEFQGNRAALMQNEPI